MSGMLTKASKIFTKAWKWDKVLGVAFCLLLLMGLFPVYFQIQRSHSQKDMAGIPKEDMGQADFVQTVEKAVKKRTIDLREVYSKTQHLRIIVKRQNKEQLSRLGMLIPSLPNAAVLQIQVGQDTESLQVFLDHVRNFVNINRTTIIIFVLENFNSTMQETIQQYNSIRNNSITLINPYCTRLHPFWFPGDEIQNCHGHGASPDKKLHLRCRGMQYRNPNEMMSYHAWVWSSNTVQNALRKFPKFKGFVVHIDYTDLIVPGAFLFLNQLHKVRLSFCPDCAISLMSHRSSFDALQNSPSQDREAYAKSTVVTGIRGWNLHGVSFSDTSWRSMRTCARVFCDSNSTDWRWSIPSTVKHTCFQGSAFLIVPKVTRLITRTTLELFYRKQCNRQMLNPIHRSHIEKSRKLKKKLPQVLSKSDICDASLKDISRYALQHHDTFPFSATVQSDVLKQELPEDELNFDEFKENVNEDTGSSPKDLRDKQLCHASFLELDIEDTHLDPGRQFGV